MVINTVNVDDFQVLNFLCIQQMQHFVGDARPDLSKVGKRDIFAQLFLGDKSC